MKNSISNQLFENKADEKYKIIITTGIKDLTLNFFNQIKKNWTR